MLIRILSELHEVQWKGALDAAQALDANLITLCGSDVDNPHESRSSANAIYELANSDRLDGLIIWTAGLTTYVDRARMEAFCRQFEPLPMVSLEQALPGYPSLLQDDRGGMRAAVSHLIEAHGHTRIAFIQGPAHHLGAGDRYQGYREALSLHGMPFDLALVTPPTSDWDSPEVVVGVRALFAQPSRVEAIVGATDSYALVALAMLEERHLRVPEDVALVGFDDDENIAHHDLGLLGSGPPREPVDRVVHLGATLLALTTVRPPFYQLGWQAVETLVRHLRGQAVPPIQTLPTELIVRTSCGCFTPANAISDPSTVVPSDVLDRLGSTFVDAIASGSAETFMGLLGEAIRSAGRAGARLEDWWSALEAVCRQRLEQLEDPAAVERGESVWLRAQRMMAETTARLAHYRELIAQRRVQVTQMVGQRLVTSLNVPDLASTLARELPNLGIPSCYLALYASPTESQASLVYEDGERLVAEGEPEHFPTLQLVPRETLCNGRRCSLVALALYFKEERLGFVLFEVGPRIGSIYEGLQAELSSALQSARLLERERRALAAVEEARLRAEAANQAKSVFLANISHELRTPLNAILGYAEILQQHWPTTDVDEGLRIIQQSGQHLLMLINDVLDVAKIEAGKLDLRPGIVPLARFLDDMVEIVRARTAANGLAFAFEPSYDLPSSVKADETRLRQVLLNLLGNAVKFTNAGRVALRVKRLPAAQPGCVGLRFSVEDTGVGIAPEHLTRIFQPFEQVGESVEGTGLGLAISFQLLQLMDSCLQVRSQPGKGTCFWFDLNLPVAQIRPPKPRGGRRIIGYRGPRRRVLVVDDTPSNRAVLIALLRPAGFELLEANDGRQAVELAQRHRPDIIIMDRRMPVLDGASVVRELRRLPEFANTPMIATSAVVSASGAATSPEIGFSGFLPRPMRWKSLADVLATVAGIEWILDEADGIAGADGDVMLPTPEELEQLYHLARSGDMSAIRGQAETLELMGAQYGAFAAKLRQLALDLDDAGVVMLLEAALHAPGDSQASQPTAQG